VSEGLDVFPRASVFYLILFALAIVSFAPLHTTGSVVPHQTTNVTVTVSVVNVTEISYATTTVPAYVLSTIVQTIETTVFSTTQIPTTVFSNSTQLVPVIVETTYKTSFIEAQFPSQGALSFGLLTMYFLGAALGYVTAGKSGNEAEKIGGLLAALGFVFWGVVQFFGGFSPELANLVWALKLNFGWWLIIYVCLGLYCGYYCRWLATPDTRIEYPAMRSFVFGVAFIPLLYSIIYPLMSALESVWILTLAVALGIVVSIVGYAILRSRKTSAPQ